MLADYLVAPSLTALFVTGFIILTVIILIVTNYKSIISLNYYKKILLLTGLSVTIATHGLIYAGVEKRYNFNPYKWI
jgi:hypothetical protein